MAFSLRHDLFSDNCGSYSPHRPLVKPDLYTHKHLKFNMENTPRNELMNKYTKRRCYLEFI